MRKKQTSDVNRISSAGCLTTKLGGNGYISHNHALLDAHTQIINLGGASRLRQADPKYSLGDIKRWETHRMHSG